MKALTIIYMIIPLFLGLSGCLDNVSSEDGTKLTIITSSNTENDKILRFSTNNPTEDEHVKWDFGDGFIGFGSPIRHEYLNPGVYNVKLQLTREGQLENIEKQIIISGDRTQVTVNSLSPIVIDSDTNDPNISFESNNITPQIIASPATVSGILMSKNGCQAGRLCKDGDTLDQYLIHLNFGQQIDLAILEGALDIKLYDPQGTLVVSKNYLESPLSIDKNQLAQGAYLLILALPTSVTQTQYSFSISEQSDSGLYQPGKLIVTWENQSIPELVDIQDPRLQAVHNQGIHAARVYLAAQKNVRSVSLNYLRFPSTSTNFFPSWQWPLQLQKIDALWQPLASRGQSPGENVRVAVLDTGLYLAHENLSQLRLEDGFDFVSDPINSQDGDGWDNNPDDPGDAQQSYHGSHVTGIIAAQPLLHNQYDQKVLGISWGATIMPIRVLGQHGGTSYDLIQAMRYAAGLENDSKLKPSKPADIINLSLGGGSFSAAEQATINEVINSGCIIVAAAGNDAIGQVEYPARYQNVIAVGAYGQAKTLSHYSNYGLHLDLLAPGGECSDANCSGGITSFSAIGKLSGGYDTRSASVRALSGTSMASAHVSALIAIMRSYLPALDSKALLNMIRNGQLTQDWNTEGFDRYTGWGNLDSEKILTVMDSSPLSKSGIWTPQLDLYLSEDATTTIPLTIRGHNPLPLTIQYDQTQLDVMMIQDTIRIQALASFKQTQTIHVNDLNQSKLTITVHPKKNPLIDIPQLGHLYVTNAQNHNPIARAINQDNTWTAQIEKSQLNSSIQISTDIDYDGIYCEPGEFCAFTESMNTSGITFLEGTILQN